MQTVYLCFIILFLIPFCSFSSAVVAAAGASSGDPEPYAAAVSAPYWRSTGPRLHPQPQAALPSPSWDAASPDRVKGDEDGSGAGKERRGQRPQLLPPSPPQTPPPTDW